MVDHVTALVRHVRAHAAELGCWTDAKSVSAGHSQGDIWPRTLVEWQ